LGPAKVPEYTKKDSTINPEFFPSGRQKNYNCRLHQKDAAITNRSAMQKMSKNRVSPEQSLAREGSN
jgi:hypothetical protein